MATEKAKPGATSPVGSTAPLPSNAVQNPASTSGSVNPAASDVAKHGGTPSGKIGVAGTVPGTPEHADARRETERLRKANYRARKRAENPPALPVNLPGVASPTNSTSAPAVDPAAVSASPVVPWNVEPLRPLVEGLVSTAEQLSVTRQTAKAAKAKLPTALLKKIEDDARWNPLQKTSIVQTAPPVIADALNEAGISGKYQPLTILGLTIASLFYSQSAKSAATDKLIAEYTVAKPAEEKKPDGP